MIKKIYLLLALVMTVVTASAIDAPSFKLKKAQGAEAHGTIKFYVGENLEDDVTTAKEGELVTVIISPSTGWVVNAPAGEWNAAIAAARNTDDPVEMLKEFSLSYQSTDAQTAAQTWTFTMERADAEISCKYKKLLTHTDITVADIAALTYTGSALEPVVTVKDGQTTMTLWNAQTQTGDYTVSYSNNVNAALSTAGDKAPTVTITAVESSELYSGSTTKTFTINPKALEASFIADIPNQTYTGQEVKPEPAITYNSMTLAKGTDFTYSYVNNILNAESTDNNAPKLTITAVTPGNYSGSASKTFTIEPKAITADLVDPIEAVTYNGTAFKPAPVLTYNEMTLVEGTDYTVAYANNVEAGTADVIITGMGHYTSAATVHFTIHKGNIEIEAPKAIEELVYNGEAQALVIAGKAIGGEMQYSLDGTTYTATLPTGTDAKEYTVHYKAVGDKNHDDRPGSNFKVSIAPAELTAVTLEETNLVYNQEEQTVQIATVSAGTLTVPAAGYEVSGNKATVVDNYTITVKGKGNFKGEAKAQWSIVAADANIFDVALATTEFTYDGTEQTPEVTVKDGATVLEEGTDYTVSYTNNVNAGTATVTATGMGYYSGTKTATFTIGKAALTVTADDTSVIYGNEPLFSASYEGFVNGETEEVLSGILAFDCDYTKESPVGSTHAIMPKGLTSNNYDITFVEGTMTVITDQDAIEVKELIDAIGEVEYTPESKAKIDAARKAYDELTDAQKTLVDNYDVLIDAEEKYAELKAAAAKEFEAELATATFTYTGEAIEPAVIVTYGDAILEEGTDYTVTYSNNVDAGTGTVTVTGLGDYVNAESLEFTIEKADVTATAPTAVKGLKYDAKAHMLVEAGSTDYGMMQYSLDGNSYSATLPQGTNAGEYDVYYKVAGDKNHKDTEAQTVKVTIEAAALSDVTLAQTELTYNQQEQSVSVGSVKAGALDVKAGEYEVKGNSATEIGTYTVTVTGKGNFKGDVTATFTIKPAGAEALFNVELGTNTYTYDGTEKKPVVTVKDGNTVLKEGVDYTVAYTNNVKAGTATVTVTGMGNYSGTKIANFTIEAADISSLDIELEYSSIAHDGNPKEPAVIVKDGPSILMKGEDYNVIYEDNVEVGTAKVIVSGIGNYTGISIVTFLIKGPGFDIDAENSVSGEKVVGVTVDVTILNEAGKKARIENLTVPGSAAGEKLAVYVPATVGGYKVTEIASGTIKDQNVTDIYLPDTEEPIDVEEGALPEDGIIHTTLELLDDYAMMPSLKTYYERSRVMTTVTPANKFWTLGTGCDVILPEALTAFTVKAKSETQVSTVKISEDDLAIGGKRVVKANNGVLLLGEAGKSYDLIAYSGRIANGTPIVTTDNKDYGTDNLLQPIVEKIHFNAGDSYFVMKDNEFHAIKAEDASVKVPAGKAVLHLVSTQAGARALVLGIDAGATGIGSVGCDSDATYGNVFDLQGRRVVKAAKGTFIVDGKVVVVK